ncbi:YgaP family membrane protein [Flavobacterium sp. 3HN19-14]|uniref:YgaP family membrane protein n=1 Tax=Flavobacterium sp. 3HN19-14 TaxID=3448133 RepID=UPI003EE1A5FF
MKKNISNTEKYVRYIVGIFIVAGIFLTKDELVKNGCLILGCYVILSAFMGWCLVYSFLGISTVPSARKKRFY